jgi:hypothetical protein
MSACGAHLDQAVHNREFSRSLIVTQPITYRDWAVVGSFYSAVHFVEALRDNADGTHTEEQCGRSQSPHEARLDYVDANLPDDVVTAYHILYRASRWLRYLEYNGQRVLTKGLWMSDADVTKLVEVRLCMIADNISARLKKSSA